MASNQTQDKHSPTHVHLLHNSVFLFCMSRVELPTSFIAQIHRHSPFMQGVVVATTLATLSSRAAPPVLVFIQHVSLPSILNPTTICLSLTSTFFLSINKWLNELGARKVCCVRRPATRLYTVSSCFGVHAYRGVFSIRESSHRRLQQEIEEDGRKVHHGVRTR